MIGMVDAGQVDVRKCRNSGDDALLVCVAERWKVEDVGGEGGGGPRAVKTGAPLMDGRDLHVLREQRVEHLPRHDHGGGWIVGVEPL